MLFRKRNNYKNYQPGALMGSEGSKIPIIQKIKKMFVKVENIYMTKLRENICQHFTVSRNGGFYSHLDN